MLPENLIFIICAPRSGSTLLQRMVGSHAAIYTHPEPHLLTPLYYLGYFDSVSAAPYDHVNAAQALRELCRELPQGEEDYLDALRAYAGTLYGRVLGPAGKRYFCDKTPAYALVAPFVYKLYPQAKYIVLTRHPLAIHHSVAHSFFAGDYLGAAAQNPIISAYVPAIGAFLRQLGDRCVHVRYEDLVQHPTREMARIFTHLGVQNDPGVVDYGRHHHINKSYGDPMSVNRHTRPVSDSLDTWANDLLARPDALAQARHLIDDLDPDDLQTWGYPRDTLLQPLEGKTAQKTLSPSLNAYRLKRQILLSLRHRVRDNALGEALRKVRYYCDVILRP